MYPVGLIVGNDDDIRVTSSESTLCADRRIRATGNRQLTGCLFDIGTM